MENVVLGLLILLPMTLYDLNQAFKQGISLFYSASMGSLQVAVRNLLGKGWIVCAERVERGRNKKVYSITEDGRAAFYQWMLAETPANKLEVTALSKVYFLGLVPEAAQRRQILVEILARIDAVYGQLSGLQDEIGRLDPPEAYRDILKFQLKTLDYGLQAHVFARAWFEALLGEVESEETHAGR